MFGLWGKEAKRQREIEDARDAVLEAWDNAHRRYRNAMDRGDTRDQNTAYQALREAMSERLKAGC